MLFRQSRNRLALGLDSGFVARKHAHSPRMAFSDFTAASPGAGAGLSLEELAMPDLDLIKQEEQGLGTGAGGSAAAGRAIPFL